MNPDAHAHDHVDAQTSHDDGPNIPLVLDPTVPDEELPANMISRRRLLRAAGLLGAGAAAGGNVLATPGVASASRRGGSSQAPRRGYVWLAGDHHIHTQYSGDAIYRVVDQVQHGRAYGLDWMVITDHGSAPHARIGVELVNPDIQAARERFEDMLVFQGLEWNIPAAEHGTVFVHPGANEVAVLKEFENTYDGTVTGTGASTPANEAHAAAAITFLGRAVDRRRIKAALFLANHPARRGIDSPHEFRAWRDADPSVAVGMEGAPGHQAAGIAPPNGPGSGRGFYDNSPSAASFPGYPLESYRTWGGFDWFTSTVGGLWDSLLAEGKPWWISANSDAHFVIGDTAVRGPNSNFEANGRYEDPVHGGTVNLTAGDYWPGYYSRTHVGATSFSYGAVMDGIREGRVWVDHGGLISGLDVRARVARSGQPGVPLGGTLQIRRGDRVELVIDIDLADGPNWAQFVPTLARVDVIQGDVTGPVSDPDAFTTPNTRVVQSYDVGDASGRVSFTYQLGRVESPLYLRVRGTDGNRSAPGWLDGGAVDPVGPAIDVVGDADPWLDLWFYSNPIFVVPRR